MGFLLGCMMGGAIGMGVWSVVEEDWTGVGLYGFILLLLIVYRQWIAV